MGVSDVFAVSGALEVVLEGVAGKGVMAVVYGSTRTSTIPGISIAGPSPEATLYTPTLDIEYLVAGRPLTLDVVPVSPEGVPTPAVITRAVARAFNIPLLPVDAGSWTEARVPHAKLPSRVTGGRIDVEPGLPSGASERLFREAYMLGSSLARGLDWIAVGESIPGGTTVAAAVMEALGYRAADLVSSSGKDNPRELKKRVVAQALSRLRECGARDVLEIVDCVGDPVHVSIAGLAVGAREAGAFVILAGGTQMGAVLAILSRLGMLDPRSTAVATTKWIALDRGSSIRGIVESIAPGLTVAAAGFSLEGSRYRGLRMYEEGYAKEGVGAGGSLVISLLRGAGVREILEAVESEYGRLLGG
ncbi:conserved hypothetical protein [Aeropyrum pernix K1]|uniref:UPF0284 protein APE_2029.1 n=1 Tax=Aeropyrum pernix (strain ATCC 700893 / DSM 11879 / JCM 9820 / NBRC 100138 / K1) TaxID=272557 RepID=Y2029_AERPE|nr:TIGR00303 family protein [Aeropyrum pernix]Q9YAB0.2 RecName: Full=UPF0284 protein APE_2029.1 [Aeropyrum pernix K1]BAA81039.2 conserved hypothetical protein [Aeropyrum pernix K1]